MLIQGNALTTPLPDSSVHCVITSVPYFNLRDYGDSRQIGQEATIESFTESIVQASREIWRVLRSDGTYWLNIGDSHTKGMLNGVPWKVAFALVKDGWRHISDIIWHKPDARPEGDIKRPHKDHEYIFLFAKSKNYYYDQVAVRNTSNLRTVWRVPKAQYKGEHFAGFSPDLIKPCILASTSDRGVCYECGSQWQRVVEKGDPKPRKDNPNPVLPTPASSKTQGVNGTLHMERTYTTVNWEPTCACDSDVKPAIVLDPFSGTGTTALTARNLSRHGIGIDLNLDYCQQGITRFSGKKPKKREKSHKDLPLWKHTQ